MNREDVLERRLWLVLLLLVPVSSSPFLPLGSGTLIRPLAFVPAVLLLFVAAARILFLEQRPNFNPDRGCFALLFAFAAYVLIAGLIRAGLIPDEPFKGQTPLDSLLRAVATVAIGMLFYVIARLKLRTRADALLAEKFLFIGLSASVALAVVQVVAIVIGGDTLRTVQAITDLFAVRFEGVPGILNRGQGMGLEPSALAYQIILLMVPFLVARSISRQDFAGGPVRRRISPWVGFIIVLVGLLCTGSRFGIGSALIILLVSSLRAVWRGRLAAAVALIIVLGAGSAGVFALRDAGLGAGTDYVVRALPVVTEITSPQLGDPDQAVLVSDALGAAGRIAASQAAATMWLDYPAFGVSLGNAYRYFGRYFPDWALNSLLFATPTSEGFGWLDPFAPDRGNAKNLLLRLLAETGLVGTGLFLLFFVRNIFFFDRGDRYYGAFRIAATAALCLNWVNSDTFADPAMWILLAFCHAAGSLQAEDSPPPFRAGAMAPAAAE